METCSWSRYWEPGDFWVILRKQNNHITSSEAQRGITEEWIERRYELDGRKGYEVPLIDKARCDTWELTAAAGAYTRPSL